MVVAAEAYDVFVSYSRADARHAADIDAALRSKGLSTFFDRRELAAGVPWVRALEQAIGAAKAVIVLIGPRGLGNTQHYESELALVRQTGDPAFPVVPVILPDTTTDRPFDFLNLLTWVDFSRVSHASDAPEELQRLVAAVRGAPISGALAQDAICPYRGLNAFREEDAAFFFGRGNAREPESPIGQLVRKVHEDSFVMVVGRSGSGKSSLVHAGLFPALRRERDKFWSVLSLRPGAAPLRALAAAFNPRGEDEGAATYQAKLSEEAERLRSDENALLAHMIRDALDHAEGRPDRLLLYIDQWEELYAQAPSSSDKERAAQHSADVDRFIDVLLFAARTAPVSVVATVRADFYDPLIAHPEIRELLPTRQVLLGAMPRAELERTIVEPAKKVGLTFDPPGLVQRILDEAGEDEGMLPLLQYALEETWARREGNTMTAGSYARSGGVREAIRITAERTFEALSIPDKQAARKLFLRLVTPGEGQEDTRARAAMPSEAGQREIVRKFADPRTRLLVTGSDNARRPTVEVAHEALIRTWPLLRLWIDTNREKLRARAAVVQAKAEWEKNDRRDDLLLPAGFQLERARSLVAEPGDITTDDLAEFVSLSSAREEAARKQAAAAQRRQVRNRNYAIAVVSVLALAAAGSFFRAEQQRRAAETSLALAEVRKERADSLLNNATHFIFEFQEKFDSDAKKKAFDVFQAGTAHGDVVSMHNLGVGYQFSWNGVQDYAKAYEWYLKAADRGNPGAMNKLGRLYMNGHGIARDYAKAHEWYEKAADKGEKVAMSDLGFLYQDGHGVAQDYTKAREWWEKAADKGEASAMRSIGWLYANGRGVAQDYAKAREWYEKAADKDDVDAMNNLGILYSDGHGVPQDYAKARAWYEKAADKGHAAAMYNLGVHYANGQGVPQDYAKAHEWYEKAAAKGDAAAMTNLGVLYMNGHGIARDYPKARELFEKAAEKGEALAMSNLGALYQNGLGVARDYPKARELFEKAAEKGEALAMSNLGALYQNGLGVARDYAKARELFEKAAEKGLPEAMSNLGALYQNGLGVARDYAKARELLEKATEKGSACAMANLGVLYLMGQGVAQDDSKARELLEKAKAHELFQMGADQGDAMAMLTLGVLYHYGYSVPQDYAKARDWYEKAVGKDLPEAMVNLGALYMDGQGVPQDYAKARELFEKASAAGVVQAERNLGVLYENGRGVPQDYATARAWYEKAAEKGEPSASAKLEALPIREALGTRRYAEALRFQEALAAKREVAETAREGKPGKETADALLSLTWCAVLAREFTKAATVGDRGHALFPSNLSIETNRAHALMFLNRKKDATALYLAYKGKPMSASDDRLWERVIADDFAELRKAGLTHPMMADIERKLGIAR
jgi:TPR repeat protein/energy-coupling factor transporter ATP-binding protein EcfA2